MVSDQFLPMKNFLWQSESREKVRLDGKRQVSIEDVVCKGLLHRKMYGRQVSTYSEEVLKKERKGNICVLKFSFSV